MEDFTINEAQQGKFEIYLSNLPTYEDDFLRDIDLRKFNNFVKSVNVPESSMNLQISKTYGGGRIFPAPSFNYDMPEFSITYGLDENMSNYWYMFNWIWSNRNARSMNDKTWMVNSKINEAILCFKNNNGKITNYVNFDECYISNLSSIDFQYGAYEDIRFTVTFKFNGIRIDHFGNIKGANIDKPLTMN